MAIRILSSTIKQLIGSSLRALLVYQDRSLWPVPISEDYRLLASQKRPDLIDTVLEMPYQRIREIPLKPSKNCNEDVIPWIGARVSLEFILEADKIYSLIGFSHTHPHDLEPSGEDISFLKQVEQRLCKPFYGIVLGNFFKYNLALALDYNKNHGKITQRMSLSERKKFRDFLNSFEIGHKKTTTMKQLVCYYVSRYLQSVDENINMYDSDGKKIRLRIV